MYRFSEKKKKGEMIKKQMIINTRETINKKVTKFRRTKERMNNGKIEK